MFNATLRGAVDDARTLAQLDELSRLIWQAHAAETVTDDEAQGLAETLHARRATIREAVAPVGIPLGRATVFPAKRLQRAPNRSEAISRRRRLACSGPMPPGLASRFTVGELAVLRIVGDEVAAGGDCRLCVDALAARAGVCRRLAQAAIRLAEGDGLLTIEERRHQGRKNDPNVIRILSREWTAWLKRGRRTRDRDEALLRVGIGSSGCKRLRPTDNGSILEADSQAEPSRGCRQAAGDPTRSEAYGGRAGGDAVRRRAGGAWRRPA